MWFNGTQAYLVDEENKIVKILNENEEIGVVYKESFASLYPGYISNAFERLLFAGNFSNKIKTQYYNGEKCIVIETKNENYTKTYWITENFKSLVQAKIEFANGDIYEYKYNISFHTTKLKDIELPDITEYTVIDETNGNKIDINTLKNDTKLKTQNVVVENIIDNMVINPVG